MKYMLKTIIAILALTATACAPTTQQHQASDTDHDHHHEHGIFETWILVHSYCCGRDSRITYPMGHSTMTLRADSTYLLETTQMTNADLQKGRFHIEQKEGNDFIRLGIEGHWGIVKLSGDTLTIDYSYMDLAKEYYVVTHGHKH